MDLSAEPTLHEPASLFVILASCHLQRRLLRRKDMDHQGPYSRVGRAARRSHIELDGEHMGTRAEIGFEVCDRRSRDASNSHNFGADDQSD
jgi:hypothetical protein